jgi:IclR helix-turn-helix domain
MSSLTTYSWPGALRLARVDVLAERTGAHAPSLHRLLRTLASCGAGTRLGGGDSGGDFEMLRAADCFADIPG